MINLLFSGATSACFELQNDSPYYAPEAYRVYLNGEQVREGDSNVFSLRKRWRARVPRLRLTAGVRRILTRRWSRTGERALRRTDTSPT